MTESRALRYALGCSLAAAASAAVLFGLNAAHGTLEMRWALIGWAVASITGVASGARLASLHGAEGPGFIVAYGTCMLVRSIAYVAGGWAAMRNQGTSAIWAYLAGLGAGYVSTQGFEMFWFARRTSSAGRAGAQTDRARTGRVNG